MTINNIIDILKTAQKGYGNLPIHFMVENDIHHEDQDWSAGELGIIEEGIYATYNEFICDNYDNLLDAVYDDVSDECYSKNIDMSDDEISEEAEKRIEEKIKPYDCIWVHIGV